MATETQRIVLGSQNLASLTPSKKIDTRGLVCPYPSFETAKIAGSATRGDVLEIITDDKYVATSSIPTVLKTRNYEFAVLESSDGTFSIKARKLPE